MRGMKGNGMGWVTSGIGLAFAFAFADASPSAFFFLREIDMLPCLRACCLSGPGFFVFLQHFPQCLLGVRYVLN